MSKHRFSTGLTEISSRKVFHDGCAKRDIFSQQILNKNGLCLAHCALNRSFTVVYFIGNNQAINQAQITSSQVRNQDIFYSLLSQP